MLVLLLGSESVCVLGTEPVETVFWGYVCSHTLLSLGLAREEAACH